jgi:hypothetical protein
MRSWRYRGLPQNSGPPGLRILGVRCRAAYPPSTCFLRFSSTSPGILRKHVLNAHEPCLTCRFDAAGRTRSQHHLHSPPVSFDLAGLGRPGPRLGILNRCLVAHGDSPVTGGEILGFRLSRTCLDTQPRDIELLLTSTPIDHSSHRGLLGVGEYDSPVKSRRSPLRRLLTRPVEPPRSTLDFSGGKSPAWRSSVTGTPNDASGAIRHGDLAASQASP